MAYSCTPYGESLLQLYCSRKPTRSGLCRCSRCWRAWAAAAAAVAEVRGDKSVGGVPGGVTFCNSIALSHPAQHHAPLVRVAQPFALASH